MKLKCFFVFFVLLVTGTFAAHKTTYDRKSLIIQDSQVQVDTIRNDSVKVSFTDALTLKIDSEATKDDGLTSSEMAWIVALVIGVLTVAVNLIIAALVRRHNKVISDNQIDSLKRNLEVQIISDKEIKLAELKLNHQTRLMEGKLNAFINTFTEFLTFTLLLTPTNQHDDETSSKFVEKINAAKIKIELLLKPDKNAIDEKVINSLKEMIEVVIVDPKDYNETQMKIARNNCIDSSRDYIDSISERINSLNI